MVIGKIVVSLIIIHLLPLELKISESGRRKFIYLHSFLFTLYFVARGDSLLFQAHKIKKHPKGAKALRKAYAARRDYVNRYA